MGELINLFPNQDLKVSLILIFFLILKLTSMIKIDDCEKKCIQSYKKLPNIIVFFVEAIYNMKV